MLSGMSLPRRFCLFVFGLLCLALTATSLVPGVHPEDPAKGVDVPPIDVEILEKAPQCDKDYLLQPAMFAMIEVSLYMDDRVPLPKAKPLMIFRNKQIRGVNRFHFIPGVELGLIGACPMETRLVRFPAELGFPEGSPAYKIPPNSPLRAVVKVFGYFHGTEEDMKQDEAYVDQEILAITGGKDLARKSYTNLRKASTQAEFESITRGRMAVIFLHTKWCKLCGAAEGAMKEVAAVLAGGLRGDSAKQVVAVSIDATRRDREGFVESFGARAFPTIVLRRPDGSQVEYSGTIESQALLDFVEAEYDRVEG